MISLNSVVIHIVRYSVEFRYIIRYNDKTNSIKRMCTEREREKTRKIKYLITRF